MWTCEKADSCRGKQKAHPGSHIPDSNHARLKFLQLTIAANFIVEILVRVDRPLPNNGLAILGFELTPRTQRACLVSEFYMRDRTDPDAWKRAREIASKYPFRGATPPHPRSY